LVREEEREEEEHLVRAGYGLVLSLHGFAAYVSGAVGSHPRPQLVVEGRYGSGGARLDRGQREQVGVPFDGPRRGQR
jgi:hypothetical protein